MYYSLWLIQKGGRDASPTGRLQFLAGEKYCQFGKLLQPEAIF